MVWLPWWRQSSLVRPGLADYDPIVAEADVDVKQFTLLCGCNQFTALGRFDCNRLTVRCSCIVLTWMDRWA